MKENIELLEHEKQELIFLLKQLDPGDGRYFDTLKAISDIQDLINEENKKLQVKKKWWDFTPEQWFELTKLGLVSLGNAGLVIYITKWEQFHNWTSKALNLITKPKI